jgi:hypothetical protein
MQTLENVTSHFSAAGRKGLVWKRVTQAHQGWGTGASAWCGYHDKIHRLNGFPLLTKGREIRQVRQRKTVRWTGPSRTGEGTVARAFCKVPLTTAGLLSWGLILGPLFCPAEFLGQGVSALWIFEAGGFLGAELYEHPYPYPVWQSKMPPDTVIVPWLGEDNVLWV